MAQLINVRLNRVDAQPWGLRLQGGKDFGTPLVVQKVNHGSIADQAGLQPGDAVIAINNMEAFNLRHKDAQDLIVRSGNTFDLTIQRGGSTWKPHVTPTGSMPSPGQQNYSGPVTKTSLAHHPPPQEPHIGCGYNNSARPFNQNGSVKSIVNKQYNTPVGMYSEESIAETLTAQAEVLANGVLGVNFKKNEKAYNSEGSEVLKALKESENDPPEPDSYRLGQFNAPVTKHVSAPIDRPAPPSTGGLPPGQNICSDCERLIVGVFVRIKDKNLHVDCFKCATCGTSLKNQGYFNINNKLYCDVHAKLAAVQSPPTGTEGYRPGLIQPNSKLSANSTISNALSSHANGGIKSNLGGPRPFGVPTAGPRSPAMNQSWSQPTPTSFVNNYGSHTLPRSTVGQNASAVSQTTNGLAESPTTHLDINANKKPMENSLDDRTTTNDYEPGQATEMLTNSVLNLKIESDSKENFKAHAGKILTGMLESRLNNERKLQNSQAHKVISTINKSIINENNNKYLHDTNVNSTTHNGISAFQSFNSISTQKLSPNLETANNLNNNSNNIVAMPLIIPTSPIVAANATDFPPPPSPSELNDHILDFHNENHKQTTSLIGQNNLNDHDSVDNDVYSSIQTIDGFSAKKNPIQSQYQQNHNNQTHGQHQVNNQQHYDNGHSNSVVFRNKNTKPELTTHARDRRSYIEKDNFNQNRYLNHNNNLITSHATEIATGLKDGKHPVCSVCHIKITRGPFITALGRIWCPEHFICVNGSCRRPLQDIGFVEEKGDLYCEYCFEQFLAPPCDKCSGKIKGDCLNAIGKHFHPECFNCTYCGKLFGNSPFFLEDGRPYCESDWNELFTTKCFACGFPVEAGDRWVEALSHNYHSQCFNCTMCKKNLEGQSFYAKAGRPYCKNHAR